jgi:DNA-directed RNA polymerase specialized sigma24 family protein
MPYADAARIAGCPVGTVMSRVFRARRMMRAFLEREGGEHARSAEAA